MSRPLTLLESARVLGRIRYVELAAFERLGRRAPSATSPPAAAYLSGASLAHAWRAALLEDHLPVSQGLPGPAELTRSPGDPVDQVLRLLGPPASPGDKPGPGADDGPDQGTYPGADGELVAALVGVLYPAMLAGYERRIALASPAADPPLVRTLRRATADLAAVLDDGRRLLGATPGDAPPRSSPPAPLGGLAGHLAGLIAGRPPFGPIGQHP